MASSASRFCKEILTKVGYGKLSCKLWGENVRSAEKFVALHGWLDNAGSFDPLMEKFLTKERCVACLDFPGHGLSSHLPPGIPYSPAIEIQGVRSIVKQLGWTKYNIIGHSMGAMRAVLYAMCYPEEVTSVVALDGVIIPLKFTPGAPYPAFGRQLDKYMKYCDTDSDTDREHTWEELKDRWLSAVKDLREDDFNILMRRGSRQLDNGMYIYTRDKALHSRTNMVLTHTTDTIIDSIKQAKDCSFLFIHSKMDFTTTEENRKVYLSHIKRLEVECPGQVQHIHYGGAHHFHMQEPEEICAILTDFYSKRITTPLSSI